MNVAVLGATGLVGEKVVEILEERDFPVGRLTLFAGASGSSREMFFKGKAYKVQEWGPESAEGVQIAFLAVDSQIAREVTPGIIEAFGVVIDKSSAYRGEASVPLVIPEVNGFEISNHKGIIASPNCMTIPIAMILHNLRMFGELKDVVVSTYQSASGAGRKGLSRLEEEIKNGGKEVTPGVEPLAFNVNGGGWEMFRNENDEEIKVRNECQKILGEEISMVVTTVRVPVRVGHMASVVVTFENKVLAEDARDVLNEADGIKVIDTAEEASYPAPLKVAGRDEVLVGRVREVPGNRLSLLVAVDNLRKGAALNAVQIAETLIDPKGKS